MNTAALAESGIIPIWLIRHGIRQRLRSKLKLEYEKSAEDREAFIAALKESPIAIATDDANEQHYQVPTDFYVHMLGPRMKYSACYWPEGVQTLDQAEEASLRQVAERALLGSGQSVLELGCGWGSFSLWAAEQYPTSTFLAVSNSKTQAEYIRAKAVERGIGNLSVVTENILHFDPKRTFDRIVSIEMFEHMRNYQQLFHKVAGWLNEEGRCFVHVFSHRHHAYTYEASDRNDWMSNYFFTGGTMPSHDLFSHFSDDLAIEQDWTLNGLHYTRTLEAWLTLLNANLDEIKPIFEAHYGSSSTRMWIQRWRIFLLACSELFGFCEGEEWGVSHYRFKKAITGSQAGSA